MRSARNEGELPKKHSFGAKTKKKLQIWLAKGVKSPIIRRTQRRAVVEKRKTPVRRYFLLFNKPSDKLCGHWLMTSLKKT